MTFSQGWDAGFKSVLIYIGIVFLWLIYLESLFGSQRISVVLMNIAALVVAGGFFLYRRWRCHAERRLAEEEVARILAESE